MSPTKFTSFAVAGGSGLVGKPIVASLVAAGAQVVVLSRSAETKLEGAVTKAVDFESVASVQDALEGVEVVISALGGAALGAQPVLAQAAKAAGAQLFLPSEFGIASKYFAPDSPLHGKRAFAESLRELGLPALLVANGVFLETTFAKGAFGLHYPDGEAHIVGSVDTVLSFTSIADVGSFLAPLLTATPASDLVALGEVSIQGSRASWAATLAAYEAAHPGRKVNVTITPIEQAEAELASKEGLNFIFGWLTVAWAKSEADVTRGGAVEPSNGLVPGWKPQSVQDYLASL